MRPQVQTPVPTKILNVSTKKQYWQGKKIP
jgi:hypothetical protein